MKPKVIAVVSQKGGAGKTPSAIALSYALARYKLQVPLMVPMEVPRSLPPRSLRVLLVDADPQGSATLHFIGPAYKQLTTTLYNAITTLKPIDPIVVTDSLHLLPAHDELSHAEVEVVRQAFYQPQMKRLLANYEASYDYIIIDTPGSNASIFTTLALVAAHFAIVPVKTEFSAEQAMIDTMDLISDVRGPDDSTGLNPGLVLSAIIPTQYESGIIHHREVLESLRTKYGRLVLDPAKKSTRYNDATAHRCDVADLAPALRGYWDSIVESLVGERSSEAVSA